MSDGGEVDMPDVNDTKTFDRDSISNTLIISISLSLVCSILVASAAVVLKPIQLKNAEEFFCACAICAHCTVIRDIFRLKFVTDELYHQDSWSCIVHI